MLYGLQGLFGPDNQASFTPRGGALFAPRNAAAQISRCAKTTTRSIVGRLTCPANKSSHWEANVDLNATFGSPMKVMSIAGGCTCLLSVGASKLFRSQQIPDFGFA